MIHQTTRMKSTPKVTLTLSVLVFVWMFCLFVFGGTSPLFPFYRNPFEFAVSTSPWSLLDPMREGFLIPLLAHYLNSLVFSAHLLPISGCIITSHWWYRYDKMFFNIFAVTRCCRDRRQRRKKDEGLGSSLIKVSYENSTLTEILWVFMINGDFMSYEWKFRSKFQITRNYTFKI